MLKYSSPYIQLYSVFTLYIYIKKDDKTTFMYNFLNLGINYQGPNNGDLTAVYLHCRFMHRFRYRYIVSVMRPLGEARVLLHSAPPRRVLSVVENGCSL